MVKNLVTASLIIFVVAVIAFKINKPAVTQQSITTGITVSDVTKHNSAGDCWTIVGDKVYNVTGLIPVHAGGAQQIIAYCGKDATTAFETKNGMGQHSQRAQNILSNYYIGDLAR